jgi:hypothetical protein
MNLRPLETEQSMLPPSSDPRWTQYLCNLTNARLNYMATQMLVTRLRMMDWQKSETKKTEAIVIVRDFFATNLTVMAKDAELIFGREIVTS